MLIKDSKITQLAISKNGTGNVELGTIEKILQFEMRAELETAIPKWTNWTLARDIEFPSS